MEFCSNLQVGSAQQKKLASMPYREDRFVARCGSKDVLLGAVKNMCTWIFQRMLNG